MTEQKSVLIVEDNIQLNDVNRRALELQGCAVYTAFNLAEARAHLETLEPDVILLDVMLPDGDGIDFCGEIYGTVDSQIIFLTGKTEEEDQVKGLSSGGYAYLTKPYPIKVLLGYVEAAIRQKYARHAATEKVPQRFVIGGLEMDIAAGLARFDGADLLLTQKEFALLLLLAQNAGQTVSAGTLYETVWGRSFGDDRQSLWRRVNSLKTKLRGAAGDAVTLLTTRGEGYCLNVFQKKIHTRTGQFREVREQLYKFARIYAKIVLRGIVHTIFLS
jgi:DNA-binding response OmpR family regulator